MLNGLLGRSTSATELKASLDASATRMRDIGNRIASASIGSGSSFDDALRAVTGERPAVDMEAEMVALANEQIRFETGSKLLQKIYAQVRTSMRDR